MLNQGVSEINCYLTECYWIKELNEAFWKIFDKVLLPAFVYLNHRSDFLLEFEIGYCI